MGEIGQKSGLFPQFTQQKWIFLRAIENGCKPCKLRLSAISKGDENVLLS
jgi:hypothetical protein